MSTTQTSNHPLRHLRPQFSADFNSDNMDLSTAVRTHDKHMRRHFVDPLSGEVYSKYTDGTRFKPLTNGDGHVIYCLPKLYEFALEVRKVLPYVEFYIAHTVHDYTIECAITAFLYVYRPGDVKCMGQIGIGSSDYFTKKSYQSNYKRIMDTKSNYFVYTPYIQNNKYKKNSEPFFMKASKNITSAINTVKKSLRPWASIDIAYAYRLQFEAVVFSNLMSLQGSVYGAERDLRVHAGTMAQLIKDLVDKKVDQINNSYLEEIIYRLMRHKEALTLEENKSARSTFVLIRHDNTVDTLPFGGKSSTLTTNCTGTQVQRYQSVDELPEDLQGALAVITMLEAGGFVEGVGMKTNDRTYWVHHEEG